MSFRKLVLLPVLVTLAIFCFAQEKPKAAATPQTQAKHEPAPLKLTPDFERLKTLVGRWEGTSPEGTVVSTFRMTADGSAIMNFLFPDTPKEMLTVFHPDGANIMATHYCAMHNQPRIVAEPSSDPKVLSFKFKDVTNLTSAKEGHIEGLVITFTDADHHTEAWIARDEQGKLATLTMQLARKQ